MAIITDLKARNIKPDSPTIPHGGVVGLSLISSATKGKGKWVLRYVSPVTGKRRNAGLGSYPEISIAEAGNKGSEFRVKLEHGIDPLEVKAQQLEERKRALSIPTFQIATQQVYQTLLPSWKNEKHAKQWISSMQTYIFPLLGEMLINQIEPSHIAETLKPIWLEKAETASRVKQRVHAVMAWAWANGYCQSNPVDVVDKLLPTQISKKVRTQHQPAMPWKLIPKFICYSISNKTRYDVTRSLLLFVILTACRSGEARGMTWEEIDWENQIWTIPAERMKMKQKHRVPLSKQAMNVLKDLQGLHEKWVFPSPRKQTILSDMVLTSFLRKHNAPSDIPNRVATAHGFRSSFRDWCSEHGYARDLAERALAHTVANQVEAAYHRTDLLEQRRPMMQAWADFVMSETQQSENT